MKMTAKQNKLIGQAIQILREEENQAIACGLDLDIEKAIELLRQALGWPPGYFENVIGSLADNPIERGSQAYDEQ